MTTNTNIVLSGAPHTAMGAPILRADMDYECVKAGFRVQRKLDETTNILVTDRNDAETAREAATLGVRVMTYPDFLREALPGVFRSPATNRPGDEPARMALEDGIDYATALVLCNMD